MAFLHLTVENNLGETGIVRAITIEKLDADRGDRELVNGSIVVPCTRSDARASE